MTPTRLALGLLAIVSGLGCLFLATTDLHYRDRNCGTALFATDPNKLTLDSGDLEADEFAEQSLIANCDQQILERRFLAALPGAVGIAAVVLGQRIRDRPPKRDHGNIFGVGPNGS